MHLFIIEDDMDFSREMKDFLENSLYRVTCLTDFDRIAAQAVKLCPDLILLALNLPGTSGVEICTEIPRASDVTIIFVTGRTDSMDEVTALVKGGDDYVTKPFHPLPAGSHHGCPETDKEGNFFLCHGTQRCGSGFVQRLCPLP